MPGSVEIDLANGVGFGGDFSLDATGDLLLATEDLSSASATAQRMRRLIMTTPLMFDSAGNPLNVPDDIFNPTWGAGVPALVGSLITDSFLSQIEARIVDAVSHDPYITDSPPPSVIVAQSAPGQVSISLTVTTITGQVVTIPTLQLQVFGG